MTCIDLVRLTGQLRRALTADRRPRRRIFVDARVDVEDEILAEGKMQSRVFRRRQFCNRPMLFLLLGIEHIRRKRYHTVIPRRILGECLEKIYLLPDDFKLVVKR